MQSGTNYDKNFINMNSEKTPRRGKNYLPEILVAGLVLAGGGWFWSQNLTPALPLAPEMAAAQAQEAPPENWQAAPEKEVKAAQKIIMAQLKAFKADDYEEAAKYQASGLRQNFASTEQFRQVIKTNYPQFANYKAVTWGKSRIDGPMLQIQIVITGQDDLQIAALYSMIKENVGEKGKEKLEYRVSGVSGGSEQISDARTV